MKEGREEAMRQALWFKQEDKMQRPCHGTYLAHPGNSRDQRRQPEVRSEGWRAVGHRKDADFCAEGDSSAPKASGRGARSDLF